MGLVEVLGHFPVIWRAFQKLKKILHGPDKPDALVLIDFPEFNLRLAKQAKKAGVPVLYYVSPQVWAWRRGRVRKIAAVVDSLAAILPFEPEFYRGQDIHVEYVGHPLLDDFQITEESTDFRERMNLPVDKPVVGLFPGSRNSELRFMLEALTEAAKIIHQKRPDVHFLVPVAETLTKSDIVEKFSNDLPITYVDSEVTNIYNTASACDAVLSVSGTVTLQVAMTGVPLVIYYKVAPLTYAIGKRLIKVDHIGLANIVAEQRIVPELIQDEASAESLAGEVLKILNDQHYAETMRNQLKTVNDKLGQPGCSERVARMLLNLNDVASQN
jgi:lipid-A-disaccharide synthase